jgi:nucleoside-diphosphate-sugar epimerase
MSRRASRDRLPKSKRVTEPVLRVGNLDARRDITDVRDVVRAYRMLVEAGCPGRPYNICKGKPSGSAIRSTS